MFSLLEIFWSLNYYKIVHRDSPGTQAGYLARQWLEAVSACSFGWWCHVCQEHEQQLKPQSPPVGAKCICCFELGTASYNMPKSYVVAYGNCVFKAQSVSLVLPELHPHPCPFVPFALWSQSTLNCILYCRNDQSLSVNKSSLYISLLEWIQNGNWPLWLKEY